MSMFLSHQTLLLYQCEQAQLCRASATVWFNNMHEHFHTFFILSSALCLYLLICLSFNLPLTPLISLDPTRISYRAAAGSLKNEKIP